MTHHPIDFAASARPPRPDVIIAEPSVRTRAIQRLAHQCSIPIISWQIITNIHSPQRLRYHHPVAWINAWMMPFEDAYRICASLDYTDWRTLWAIFQPWWGWSLDYALLNRATRVSGVPRRIYREWQQMVVCRGDRPSHRFRCLYP